MHAALTPDLQRPQMICNVHIWDYQVKTKILFGFKRKSTQLSEVKWLVH